MARNKNKRETVIIDRELSPDSLRFVAPPAPRGTKRRPAKPSSLPSQSMNRSQSSFRREFDQAACIAHVKSLNPELNKNPLHELNQAWLNSSNVALPLSADTRIFIHMHKYDTYSLEGVELKVLALVQFLKEGTEVEELDPLQYLVLEGRVSHRFQVLSDALIHDGFIEWSQGRLSKSKPFLDIWKFNNYYWKEELPENIDGGIYDDYDTPPPAKKRSRIPATNLKKPSSPKKDGTANIATVRRRPSIPVCTRANISPEPETVCNLTSVSNVEGNPSVIDTSRLSTPDIHMMEDGADGIKDAFEFLGTSVSGSRPATPALQEATAVPREATPPPRERLSHPMTPTSPAPSMATLAHEKHTSMTPDPCFRPPSRHDESLSSHMFSPATSPSKPVDFHIHFLSVAGNYDPSVATRPPPLHLPLQAFFSLVADRSGVPLDSFDCLTIRYTFYGINTVVVQKDATEDAWEKTKYDIRLLYEFIRQRNPKKRDFGIWVDPGDTKTVKQYEDEL